MCACVQEEQLALYFRRKSVPEALQKRIEDYYEYSASPSVLVFALALALSVCARR